MQHNKKNHIKPQKALNAENSQTASYLWPLPLASLGPEYLELAAEQSVKDRNSLGCCCHAAFAAWEAIATLEPEKVRGCFIIVPLGNHKCEVVSYPSVSLWYL